MRPIELSLRQGLLGPTSLSLFLLSLAGAFVCCLEILSILHWCFFIFNTLLSLYASGKMVKKVCPCNQLCSNYLFFLLLLVLDCKACYPWVLGTLKLHNVLIPNFHLSSSAPFSKIFLTCLIADHWRIKKSPHSLLSCDDPLWAWLCDNYESIMLMIYREIRDAWLFWERESFSQWICASLCSAHWEIGTDPNIEKSISTLHSGRHRLDCWREKHHFIELAS